MEIRPILDTSVPLSVTNKLPVSDYTTLSGIWRSEASGAHWALPLAPESITVVAISTSENVTDRDLCLFT